MRYTTIIDISELRAVWKHPGARLLYLYMSLKCGYHDEDRDLLAASIRQLSADTGLTLSATRHAIKILTREGLLAKEGDKWRVKKWLQQLEPTPRRQAKATQTAASDIVRKEQEQIEEYQRKVAAAVAAMETDELRAWLSELRQGRSTRHNRVQLTATAHNIAWLDGYIRRRGGDGGTTRHGRGGGDNNDNDDKNNKT